MSTHGLHVEVIGSGPPLVLVHGWAMHGGIFAPLVEALRAQRTLYVVDLPGHGHSRDCRLPLQLPVLAAALRAALPPAPWCGWSLGGLVALEAALQAPRQVPALALVAASPRFVQGPDWPQGMPAQVFAEFAAGLATDWQATLDRFLALEAFGAAHMRETLRLLRAAVMARGAPDPRVLAEGLALLEQTDLRPRLPGLAAPSLWLGGRRDRLVNPAALQAAAALAPRARWRELAQAGHAPFLTEPATVAQALLAHLEEHAA